MKLLKLVTAEPYKDYIERLVDKEGLTRLAGGNFSDVFQHPTRSNMVVKVFADDPGFEKYLEWAQKNQSNPYVPKIETVVFKNQKDSVFKNKYYKGRSFTYTFVFMEKLAPLNWMPMKEWLESLPRVNPNLSIHFEDLNFKVIWQNIHDDTTDSNLKTFAQFLLSWPRHLDMKEANVMLRGKQVVFIDPIFGA